MDVKPELPADPMAAARSSDLRKKMSPAEWKLWERIKGERLGGMEVKRRYAFGAHVLGFFCPGARLAIEVKGGMPDEETRRGPDFAPFLSAHGVALLAVSARDLEADLEGTVSLITRTALERRSKPGAPSLAGGAPLLSALVPNLKGLEAALAINARGPEPLIGKVSVFTAASETFSRRNTNASIAETIERFEPVVKAAHEHRLLVRGYISCIIACPFEGPIDPGAVAAVAGQLEDLGVDEIDLGDTIGAGTPETVRTVLRSVHRRLKRVRLGSLTLHLHDTFGTAPECVKAALDFGVRSFDGAAGGLGGCPYASTPGKRAPGNIATEVLVRTIHGAGFVTAVDETALAEAGRFARSLTAGSRST
jgi:hydroxymethylglutaryl-CoA lyase